MSERERTRASESERKQARERASTRESESESEQGSKSKGEHFEFRMSKIGIYTNFIEKEEGKKKREERKGGKGRSELDVLLASCVRIAT